MYTTPTQISDQLLYQLSKEVMPTGFDSRTIQQVFHPAILNRSAFSATTIRADYLAEAQTLIRQLSQPGIIVDPYTFQVRPAGPGEQMNPTQVRAILQAYLKKIGYNPAEGTGGTIKDLSSDSRIDLILNMQSEFSAGYAREKSSQDPDILDMFPADEMYRQKQGRSQRDWQARWNKQRSSLGSRTSATEATSQRGPYIALKNDPIWTAISRFKNPYPPFDYNSGMWVRDADPDEAQRLGVTGKPEPKELPALDAPITVPVPKNLSPEMLNSMMASLGDRAILKDGQITVRSAL
ncbi:MAG: hypothetical protein PF904_10945 [Kiritimatiellae bacterium]|jgi:hypothetical protein|nr:hypothetical protein [Kiritimatiellia bacterium]